MPYRHAHYWVLLVIAVIIAGFWPSYFATPLAGPWQFHAHGVAASAWVLLVLTQSWTAQRRRFGWHAAAGKASLFLFPFLIGGLAGIIDLTAKHFVAGGDPVRTMFGGAFLIGLLVAVAAYLTLYYGALKHRRSVWPHAGYMLATPIILWESPFSRLLAMFVPGLTIAGPQHFPRIMTGILWADATALAFCLIVYWRVGARARPFLVAAAFVAAQMVAMAWMGDLALVRWLLVLIGNLPSAAVYAAGFTAGALASWAGWNAGKRPGVPVGVAVQAA